jgi:hypothetical protein
MKPETNNPTMSRHQAALLLIVASILKKNVAPSDAKLLSSAIDDVALELAALGIKPPT